MTSGDHRAAGAPVRPDAGPQADVVHELGRRLGRSRCSSTSSIELDSRRAGGAGGDQRRRPTCCPTTCRSPPIYSKVNPADAPILTLAVTSKTMPLTQVQNLVDTRVAHEDLAGARRRAGHAVRRPAPRGARPGRTRGRSAAARPDLEELRTAITAANVNQAKGSFDGPDARLHHRRQRPAAQRPRSTARLVVAYKNGAPVRLVGRRRRRRGRRERAARRLGRTTLPAIIVNVQRQPGANVIEVVDRVKALLPAAAPRRCRRAIETHAAHRPHRHHPRLGARRAVRAAARGGAGGAGDLRLPAQRRRRRSSPAVAVPLSLDRHLRRHVLRWASASTTSR